MVDENSCRFGKWFNETGKVKIKDDTKTINDLQKHHSIVHQKAKKAVELWVNKKYDEALKLMQDVEHSSDIGFRELYDSFVAHRK